MTPRALSTALAKRGIDADHVLIASWEPETRAEVEAWINGGLVPEVLIALDYRNVLPVAAPVKVVDKPKQRRMWDE
jgi:hypothetical protein